MSQEKDTLESGSEFIELAQRPPVPGKEEGLQPASDGGKSTKNVLSISRGPWAEHGGHSPVATPRRSLLDPAKTAMMEGKEEPPLGFEPEGSASTTPPFTENSTPPYLRWAESMHNLLDDAEGVEKFRKFLRQENAENLIMFWFAIKSLKMMDDSEKIQQLTKVIYRTYIRSHSEQTLSIKPEIKKTITEKFSAKVTDQNIFDCAQCEIETVLEGSMYPLFLKSDIYLQYVQLGGETPKTGEHSSNSGSSSGRVTGGGVLPTLHEDTELQVEAETEEQSDNVLPLTTKHLLATRFRRHSEANAG